MTPYLITEHYGGYVEELGIIFADSARRAITFSTKPFREFRKARNWPLIEDDMGGAALVDPDDGSHCLRADPRYNTEPIPNN
jgi:hypothetical protein